MKNPTTRTFVINKLIRDNGLKSYLEIGVSNPYVNYLDIRCPKKVSVDPCQVCEYFTKESIEEFKTFIDFQMTSDEFFAQNKDTFDIIFIDGDHSYEQSLADLNNALKIINPGGFIVLHDACPPCYENTQLDNFKKGQPYNGEVWKTVLSAIRQSKDELIVKTFPWDWGVTVIKKPSEYNVEIKPEKLDYHTDYTLPAMNPEYDARTLNNDKVSYFTSLYNTPQKSLERTARTLLNQTDPNWEWVLVDDSNNDADAARMRKYFESLNDARIKYYRYSTGSDGFIGEAKWRAASLCRGKYLAELDHDDLLMPGLTRDVIAAGDGFDFIYSNWASVMVSDANELSTTPNYPDGFAMGYGAYRRAQAVNPLTGGAYDYQECIAVPLNPKTIRHIVGVPNHIRIWNREFYNHIQGHNPDLWVVDDYELVLRSFLAGGKFLHLDTLGYLQIETGDNTTDKRRDVIQTIVAAIVAASDEAIRLEFASRKMDDWAYAYHKQHFGFGSLRYWDVPTQKNAPRADSVWKKDKN
ncbi:MAG: glycosyltransferase [Alphaproteobacteria bacterium]|nr:glycosyltransferase [Alphaproteobacteria bacterium]